MTPRETPRNSLPKTHLRRASRYSRQRDASFLRFLAVQLLSSARHMLTRRANDYFPFRRDGLPESSNLRLNISQGFLAAG